MFPDLFEALESVGNCHVELYEWAQADVRKKRLPNAPSWGDLTKQHVDLHLNGWRLAHAVVKLGSGPIDVGGAI